MKKLKVSLLAKVVIAIAAGVVFGQFLPGGIARIFVTFNSLFGNFLSFSIPLIILGLVTPAIGELGKGAGRLLALTALLAYGSTIFSGFFTYFSSSAIFPHILPVNTELTAMENPEDFMLQPYFTVAMPPPMDVMTALLLSFTIGLGLSYIDRGVLHEAFSDFQKIITKLIEAVIIPLLLKPSSISLGVRMPTQRKNTTTVRRTIPGRILSHTKAAIMPIRASNTNTISKFIYLLLRAQK